MKIEKKIGGGGGEGDGVRVDMNGEVKLFVEIKKKMWGGRVGVGVGGRGWVGSAWGIRVDVKGEMKFL